MQSSLLLFSDMLPNPKIISLIRIWKFETCDHGASEDLHDGPRYRKSHLSEMVLEMRGQQAIFGIRARLKASKAAVFGWSRPPSQDYHFFGIWRDFTSTLTQFTPTSTTTYGPVWLSFFNQSADQCSCDG